MDALTQAPNLDTLSGMLSDLINGAVEVLDISPDLHETAVERYEEVGAWLAENGGTGWEIYPQGSFRLGTVVRPARITGEYDIEGSCRRPPDLLHQVEGRPGACGRAYGYRAQPPVLDARLRGVPPGRAAVHRR
jgi:hypothetical protein